MGFRMLCLGTCAILGSAYCVAQASGPLPWDAHQNCPQPRSASQGQHAERYPVGQEREMDEGKGSGLRLVSRHPDFPLSSVPSCWLASSTT